MKFELFDLLLYCNAVVVIISENGIFIRNTLAIYTPSCRSIEERISHSHSKYFVWIWLPRTFQSHTVIFVHTNNYCGILRGQYRLLQQLHWKFYLVVTIYSRGHRCQVTTCLFYTLYATTVLFIVYWQVCAERIFVVPTDYTRTTHT